MTRTQPARWWRFAPAGWVLLLTLLIVGPALLPGFVLRYDMVFTPHQSMLDWMLGLGAGLPRAAPEDALVASIAGPFPGQLLQKAVLLAIPLLTGFGMLRLLRAQPPLLASAAATLAMWNPWVAERLLIGHWGLLLGYAAIPWILRELLDLRAGTRNRTAPLIAWIALGSVVPTASVMTILLVLPLFVSKTVARGGKLLTGFALVVFSATWWLPALFHPASVNPSTPGSGRPTVEIFGLHGESWAPPFLTALSGGGIWSGEAVLPSRQLPWIPVIGVLLLAIAAYGISGLLRSLDRTVVLWLGALAVAGYLVAVAASLPLFSGPIEAAATGLPGAGMIRDGQKLLVFLVLLTALAAPFGLVQLGRRFKLSVRPAPAGLALLLIAPLALLPDLAWGGAGRLNPAGYPQAWFAVREQIAQGPSGDAISLPWVAFRRFDWNHNQVVLDPLPRFVPTTVVTNDELAIGGPNGITRIPGDNPRSAAVAALIDSPQPLAQGLPALGITWVVQFTDQPQQLDSARLDGLELVVEQDGVQLWRTTQPAAQLPPADGRLLVVAVNLIASVTLIAALGYCVGGFLTGRQSPHRAATRRLSEGNRN